MNRKFIEHHIFSILNSIQTKPLDVFLSHYLRKHKNIGSKERSAICEPIYGMIRWRGLLDYLCKGSISWESRYEIYSSINPLDYIHEINIPAHIRVSFPKDLFQCIEEAFGEEKAIQLCLLSNTKAPTTIRTNTLKTTRQALLEKWKEIYDVSPTLESTEGITFHKRINFFGLPEFKEGLFEIQDEGSQLLAKLVQPLPKEHVFDYCAGSGGKTLAFAPSMENKGVIYLHDIRDFALEEAKKRLRRAGIQNAQLMYYDDPKKNRLKHKMEWVLVDAPCSGLGTIRRNPDMKWKINPETIERLCIEQKEIFKKALEFLHPKGQIVYATCSMLPKENEEQTAYFMKTFELELVKELKILPQEGGMDGFYGAVYKRKPI